jgi:hypothetical protein
MHFLTDDWKTDLRKLSTGGAWLFIGGSVFALLWLIFSGGGWSGRVLGASIHGQDYSAPLLAYSGFFGVVWIWTQLLTVLTATGLSVMPWAKPRRIGHALLIGWSGLWTLGSLRLAAVDPVSFWPIQSIIMAAFTGCSIHRAWRGWFPPEVPTTLRFDDEADDLLKTDPASNAPRQLVMDDIAGAAPRNDSFTFTATHVWNDVIRYAGAMWDRAKATGKAAAPRIKSVAQRARRTWSSPSQSA